MMTQTATCVALQPVDEVSEASELAPQLKAYASTIAPLDDRGVEESVVEAVEEEAIALVPIFLKS